MKLYLIIAAHIGIGHAVDDILLTENPVLINHRLFHKKIIRNNDEIRHRTFIKISERTYLKDLCRLFGNRLQDFFFGKPFFIQVSEFIQEGFFILKFKHGQRKRHFFLRHIHRVVRRQFPVFKVRDIQVFYIHEVLALERFRIFERKNESSVGGFHFFSPLVFVARTDKDKLRSSFIPDGISS